MKKLDILKATAELVVSVGVGTIVGNTIKTTTPNDIHMIKKVCVSVGSFVLSGMVSDAASKYISEQIDDTAENVQKALGRKVDDKEAEVPAETVDPWVIEFESHEERLGFEKALIEIHERYGQISVADIQDLLGRLPKSGDGRRGWKHLPEATASENKLALSMRDLVNLNTVN